MSYLMPYDSKLLLLGDDIELVHCYLGGGGDTE